MEQLSPEWHAARLGKLTGSRIADATARIKTGYSASRASLMGKLAAERLSGIPYPCFVSAAMQWGTDTEAQARLAYEFHADIDVVPVGFLDHPRLAMAGASPDGKVGSDGLVQFKCPETHTHIATLQGAPIDGGYLKQMQWEMASAERAWCDFASFDPRMPPEMQLHVRRIERDDTMIADLEKQGAAFLAELDAMVQELRTRFMLADVLKESVRAA